MINKLLVIFFLFFFTNCSFHKNSKFWTDEKKIDEEQLNIENILKKNKSIEKEINPDLILEFSTNYQNNDTEERLLNNEGGKNFIGSLQNKSSFKFSKIKDFYRFNPELTFQNNNVIFFDNKGTILNFNSSSNLLWKKNYYSKLEKKQNPILHFGNNKNTLVVVDNLANIYALNLDSGELLWKKKNRAPLNTEVKILKDKLYVVDFDNTIRCYSLLNGNELWNYKTENPLIKSQKKLSIIVYGNRIIFNNSIGDISSLDSSSGDFIWQIPTQSNMVYENSFSLKTSKLVSDKKNIYFSNNKNEFYSIDLKTGNLNWKSEVNSSLRPIIIDDLIFTVSDEGYFVILEKNTGKILKAKNLYSNFKKKKTINLIPTGFALGKEDLFVTTNKGHLIIADIKSGELKNILKIDRDQISRPYIKDNFIYVARDNAIIRLN